jgi:hypothetical protein
LEQKPEMTIVFLLARSSLFFPPMFVSIKRLKIDNVNGLTQNPGKPGNGEIELI